jgi:RNA polymerase sigma-70 factor, ECF subfamily
VVRARTDRAAFGALYDQYLPVVHRYCRRRLLDSGAADDVSSEVFLSVARSIREFTGTTHEDFRRWIYRIATNAIHAQHRQAARRGELLERAVRLGWWPCESAREQADAGDWEAVLQVLATLEPREQAVITLRFMEGLSYGDVAEIVDAQPATVRVMVSRALKQLRDKLGSRASDLP